MALLMARTVLIGSCAAAESTLGRLESRGPGRFLNPFCLYLLIDKALLVTLFP